MPQYFKRALILRRLKQSLTLVRAGCLDGKTTTTQHRLLLTDFVFICLVLDASFHDLSRLVSPCGRLKRYLDALGHEVTPATSITLSGLSKFYSRLIVEVYRGSGNWGLLARLARISSIFLFNH